MQFDQVRLSDNVLNNLYEETVDTHLVGRRDCHGVRSHGAAARRQDVRSRRPGERAYLEFGVRLRQGRTKDLH
jgi:hypothetical protein